MPGMATTSKMQPGVSGEIAKFRHFNRMYTRYLGTLNEGLLDSEYSLAEARVLWELANRRHAQGKRDSRRTGDGSRLSEPPVGQV